MTQKERLKENGWVVTDKKTVDFFDSSVDAFKVRELEEEKVRMIVTHTVPTTNIVPIGFLESWEETRRYC